MTLQQQLRAYLEAGEMPGAPDAKYQDHLRKWLASHERRFFAAASGKGDVLEISVMDVIGSFFFFDGVSAKGIKRLLDDNKDVKEIRVLIDSPGGSAFDGIAIHNLLKRHKANVTVEVLGEASSAASVVAMAGDKIIMHEGSMMMIHRASAIAMGFAEDMRTAADMLDGLTSSVSDIYETRTGVDRATIDQMVKAETWMTAREAVTKGFADSVSAAPKKQSKPASNPVPDATLPEAHGPRFMMFDGTKWTPAPAPTIGVTSLPSQQQPTVRTDPTGQTPQPVASPTVSPDALALKLSARPTMRELLSR